MYKGVKMIKKILLLLGVLSIVILSGTAFAAELGGGSGTGYPAAIDTDTSIEVDSPAASKTTARADVPNDTNAAVVAIETELGVDPAGANHTTVVSRLASIETVQYDFCMTGAAATGTKKDGMYFRIAHTITDVWGYSDTAPSGATILIDVNINGTTIFDAAGDRVTIAIAGNSDGCGTITTSTVSVGDRLSIDVDQVGSATAGGDSLYVTIVATKP